ncbi:MAG: hypothetical protein ACOC8E_01120 [Planctomycetota bacterium]
MCTFVRRILKAVRHPRRASQWLRDRWKTPPASDVLPPEIEARCRRLPRERVHMGFVPDEFALEPEPADGTAYQIRYGDRLLGTTVPIDSLRDTCRGPCFLVGTGPSIQEIDFSRLTPWPCVGVNGSILKFDEHGFDPDFYTITTLDFFHNRGELLESVVRSGTTCFFPFWGLGLLAEQAPETLSDARLVLADSINRRYGQRSLGEDEFRRTWQEEPDFALHPTVSRGDKVGFSRDLVKGYFHGENILYTALQVAYYLGFRQMFILGMDLNYSGPKPRFYETTKDSRPTWIDDSFERSIVPCFEVVRGLMDEGELAVYNLSLGSRLSGHLIPKMGFEDALRMIAGEEQAPGPADRRDGDQ